MDLPKKLALMNVKDLLKMIQVGFLLDLLSNG